MTISLTPEKARCTTGVAGLDDILNGGLIPHRLYLLDGNPGSGKTTLSIQFLREGVRLGQRCLYITLSESKAELEAGAASHGWDLDGIDVIELMPNEGDLEQDMQITMFHPSEVELNETTARILAAVEEINPDRVVVDSLSELRLLAQNTLRYRRQILALKQFFLGRNCTVLMLDDRTGDSSDLQLQSIAHGVLSLEQYIPVFGSNRRKIRIAKLRGTPHRGGYHDFNIETGGLKIFPRLVASEHADTYSDKTLKSGIAALDSLLGGGPREGTSTLIAGPAGAGKSTIALQFAVEATNRGEHAAMFMFEESIATMRARCEAIGICIKRGQGPGEVMMRTLDPAEVSPGEFIYLIRRAVEEDGAKVIIIDSLNGYLNAMVEEQFLLSQLHELLAYLGRIGVNTFLVLAQQGMFGNSHMPIETSYLADNVILHRYFELKGCVKKAISVVKMRSGKHEATIRELWFDENGVQIGEPLENLRGVLTGVPVEVKETAGAS